MNYSEILSSSTGAGMPREESVGDNIPREISGRSSASFAAWNQPKGQEDGAVTSPARQISPIAEVAEVAEGESFAQDVSAETQSHELGEPSLTAKLL